jgi:ABC-type branched-subunit amino acid transport system ATPase component
MAGHVAPGVAAFRDRVVRRLGRLARRELQLEARENVATISLITTIPEEAGRLAYGGELTVERGRELCAQLVLSSLAAFTPEAD